MQSRDFIEQLMLKLGGVALIPSTEAEAASVWVSEDDAPNGVAGYYERKRLPGQVSNHVEHRQLVGSHLRARRHSEDESTEVDCSRHHTAAPEAGPPTATCEVRRLRCVTEERDDLHSQFDRAAF